MEGNRARMISFPNQSRVFDPTRRAVRFWGHDSAMEWSFFVTEDALKRLQPNVLRDEAGLLLAFDANRPFGTSCPISFAVFRLMTSQTARNLR
jgi:hypothetical protein